jgi:phage baseplate assembly protein W
MNTLATARYDRVSVKLADNPVVPSVRVGGGSEAADAFIEIYPQTSALIDFGATGVYEVFQNVKYILLTTVFSVPLDREFGIDASWVDKPMNVAEYMIAQDVALKISMYEPRAIFRDISFTADVDGKLQPSVTIEVDLTRPLGARAIPPTILAGGALPSSFTEIPVQPTLNGYATGQAGTGPPYWIRGPQGVPGPTGDPGEAAWTFSDASFIVPPVGQVVAATVQNAEWMVVGEFVYVQGAAGGGSAAALQIVAIQGEVVTLLNPVTSSGTGIPDAPSDGQIYGRKNGTWVVIG